MLFTIQDAQRGDIHRRNHTVDLDLVGVEGVETAGATEEDTPVAGTQGSIGLEVLTDESVVVREAQHVLIGFVTGILRRLVADDAPLCREPQSPVILNDARNVLIGDVQVDTLKTVFLPVIAAQTTTGAHPQVAVLGNECTVHFVARQRVIVVIGIAVSLPLFRVGLVSPQA